MIDRKPASLLTQKDLQTDRTETSLGHTHGIVYGVHSTRERHTTYDSNGEGCSFLTRQTTGSHQTETSDGRISA